MTQLRRSDAFDAAAAAALAVAAARAQTDHQRPEEEDDISGNWQGARSNPSYADDADVGNRVGAGGNTDVYKCLLAAVTVRSF